MNKEELRLTMIVNTLRDKLIELNGNVLVRTIIQKDDKLTANSFIWDIQKSEYLLVGDVYLSLIHI